MNVICTRCGSTDVRCKAVVNPNKKGELKFPDNAFLTGWCETCRSRSVLTDTEGTKKDIWDKFAEFVKANGKEPHYAVCTIAWKDSDNCEDVKIQLSTDYDKSEDDGMLFYCSGIEEFKSLADFGGEDFIVTQCLGFECFTDDDMTDRKTFEFDIDGEKISVTGREVRAFYPKQYGLTEQDIEKFAGPYTARCKSYRQCTRQLDATLVRRLLDEERLMKVGESDGFRLRLYFDWFVILRREDERKYAPFKYAVNAYCLDNIQTFDRRYISLEAALLHCLNGFNENAAVPDRYKSLKTYIDEFSK